MNQKYIVSAIVAVLAVAGVVFYVNSSAPATVPTQNVPGNQIQTTNTKENIVPVKSATTTATAKKVAVKPSTATITGAVLTSTITKTATVIQTGKTTTTFTPTTKDIYAVLSLKNATSRTQLSYIRKFNGKYVDSKVSHPLKTGDKQFYFGWTLKAGQTRNIGNYTVTFYVDGKKAQTVSYTVR